MKNFIIEPTSNTPLVNFSRNRRQLEITGRSISLKSEKFWNEIKLRLNQLLKEENQLNISINFEYINTVNVKDLHNLLKSLKNDKTVHEKLKIQWLYDEDDNDIKDLGEMLQESSGIRFDLISLN